MVSSNASHHNETFLIQLARQPAVLAQVASTQGCIPREAAIWATRWCGAAPRRYQSATKPAARVDDFSKWAARKSANALTRAESWWRWG